MKKLLYLLLLLPLGFFASCSDDKDLPSVDITVNIENAVDANGKIYIVEGIGSIASNPNTNIGTFLYPCCYKSVTVDMNGEPDYVNLTRVTTKDGTVLWDNHSGVETIEADAPSPADDAVYDLHGRRVANPQRGAIYIRGGHKFVGR